MSDNIEDKADAQPTKRFFVSMLTRDIDLKDAILDLVDNCLDGALRSAGNNDVDYTKHSIEIDVNRSFFRIADDCGGIPKHIARTYAFKMGREISDNRDNESETIGMYGIGMKRAIFKMGSDAVVRSFNANDKFKVPISSKWLEEPNWNPLPIVDDTGSDALTIQGTTIEVRELYESVARQFDNDAFVDGLKSALGEHFTAFIQKGLSIKVNAASIEPVKIEVLVSPELDAPAPYVFTKDIEGVQVSIVVGINTAKNSDEDDDDPSEFAGERSSATAGWNIFCNDRAVIVGDKSRMTGWGDGVPLYHPQFAIITAIIEFRSASADKLPVTTTKRALDTSSAVWLEAKIKMREGLRVWTSYTNDWKNHPRSDQAVYWKSAKPLALASALQTMKARSRVRPDGGMEFNPAKRSVLPKPPDKKPSSRRVVFTRPIEEIRALSTRFFDSDDEKPGLVGERCFEIVLEKGELK